jgi:hypothetical protein
MDNDNNDNEDEEAFYYFILINGIADIIGLIIVVVYNIFT